MDVSIIVPFYNGEKYLSKLLMMFDSNFDKLDNKKIEVIFVNDNPENKLELNHECLYSLRVINNEKNLGIHRSRVEGLKQAKGKYILFLDQDDEITDNCLLSQLNKIGDNDLCICNGYMESEVDKKLIYRTKKSQKYLEKQIGFIKVRDLIVSPGHCLIKKDSIPVAWTNNFMKINSADDYMLWLLMIDSKCKFTTNFDILYTHKYTGSNISNDFKQVHRSNLEMLEILAKECKNINVKLLKRAIVYKYDMKIAGKLKPSLRNLDLFCYNAIYQLLWKGM